MAPVLSDAIIATRRVGHPRAAGEALHMGDEGHNRNKAGSILYTKPNWRPTSPGCAGRRLRPTSSPRWGERAPACSSGHGGVQGHVRRGPRREGNTIVTAMAPQRHGLRHPRLGLGSQWFTAPAQGATGSTSRLRFRRRQRRHRRQHHHRDRGHWRLCHGRGITIVTFVSGA
ncbi:MAG: DUF1116 domain-containing protein [Caldilineaceae bacterium]